MLFKPTFLFFIVIGATLSGCVAVMDILGLRFSEPKFENKEKQMEFLQKYFLDTSNLFVLKGIYCDSLASGKYDISPKEDKKNSTFNLCQYRVFDKKGDLIGGWSSDCNIIYPPFPPDAIPAYKVDGNDNLESDLKMYSTLDGKDIPIKNYFGVHQYTIVAYWAIYQPKQNLHMLQFLQGYLRSHDIDAVLLKINTGAPIHHWRQVTIDK